MQSKSSITCVSCFTRKSVHANRALSFSLSLFISLPAPCCAGITHTKLFLKIVLCSARSRRAQTFCSRFLSPSRLLSYMIAAETDGEAGEHFKKFLLLSNSTSCWEKNCSGRSSVRMNTATTITHTQIQCTVVAHQLSVVNAAPIAAQFYLRTK